MNGKTLRGEKQNGKKQSSNSFKKHQTYRVSGKKAYSVRDVEKNA